MKRMKGPDFDICDKVDQLGVVAESSGGVETPFCEVGLSDSV